MESGTRYRQLVLAILTVLALVAFMPPAQAGASWRSVASGYAIGRGTWGNPDVFDSRNNWEKPRSTEIPHRRHRTRVPTSIGDVRCWNGNDPFNDVTASGSFSSTPPITVDITAVTVSNYQWGELDVDAYHFENGLLRSEARGSVPVSDVVQAESGQPQRRLRRSGMRKPAQKQDLLSCAALAACVYRPTPICGQMSTAGR